MSSEGQYKNSALAVNSKSLFVLDPQSGEVFEAIDFDDIGEMTAKRMYSNAFLRIRLSDEAKFKNVFRYSLKLSALCDCVVSYVNGYKSGESLESRLEAVRETYDKQLLVCPQCGRSLSAPGVKCINCQGKRQTFARLAKYMKPEVPILIISVIISMITTALALLPPFLTRTLVDDVLVVGNSAYTDVKLFGLI